MMYYAVKNCDFFWMWFDKVEIRDSIYDTSDEKKTNNPYSYP